MDEVALKRNPKCLHPGFEADVVVAPGAIDQAVDAPVHGHGFLNGVRAGLLIGQFDLDEMHERLERPHFGPETLLQRAAPQNHRNRALTGQRNGYAAADAGYRGSR